MSISKVVVSEVTALIVCFFKGLNSERRRKGGRESDLFAEELLRATAETGEGDVRESTLSKVI